MNVTGLAIVSGVPTLPSKIPPGFAGVLYMLTRVVLSTDSILDVVTWKAVEVTLMLFPALMLPLVPIPPPVTTKVPVLGDVDAVEPVMLRPLVIVCVLELTVPREAELAVTTPLDIWPPFPSARIITPDMERVEYGTLLMDDI